MADSNATQKSELSEIASKINDLAAKLSVFMPVLVDINDRMELPPSIYGQIEMVASLSEFINYELSNVAVRLQKVAA